MGLTKAVRGPLTWWRYEDGQILVTCSKGHRSVVQHEVDGKGQLHTARDRKSMHCGVCTEDLPLMLDGWP